MKTSNSLLILLSVAMATMLYSFVSPMGGEGFQIYIDHKLVLEKFHKDLKKPTNLVIRPSHANSTLEVKFYHCGMAGKSRSLSLKDAQNKLLQRWEFTNEAEKNFAVSLPVKEIINFQQKSGNATLYLYYSSKEASDGRLLTGLIPAGRSAEATR